MSQSTVGLIVTKPRPIAAAEAVAPGRSEKHDLTSAYQSDLRGHHRIAKEQTLLGRRLTAAFEGQYILAIKQLVSTAGQEEIDRTGGGLEGQWRVADRVAVRCLLSIACGFAPSDDHHVPVARAVDAGGEFELDVARFAGAGDEDEAGGEIGGRVGDAARW